MGGDDRDAPTRRGVRATYDRIGAHFAATRASAWPAVASFVADAQFEGHDAPRVGLDLGCGNGRHSELLAERVERVLCLDASRTMLTTARERASEAAHDLALAQGDVTALPLATDSADLAVYVATIHHLPERELRVASLDDLARVLAPGGRALVSAWSTTHDRFATAGGSGDEADGDDDRPAEGFDTTVDWTLPGGEVVGRYYHIYAPAEFEEDVRRSDLAPVRVFEERGNCYAVVAPEGKRT